jgi:hypothetical protein
MQLTTTPVSFGPVPVVTTIRGFVKYVSDPSDIERGKFQDTKFFIGVEFYRVNDTDYKRIVGRAQVYLPTTQMGMNAVNYQRRYKARKSTNVKARGYTKEEILHRKESDYGDENSVFYYPSENPQQPNLFWPTAIVDPNKLLGQRVAILGKIKDQPPDSPYTQFMNQLKMVVIFPDPKTYLKK